MIELRQETTKVIFVPDMWQGHSENPRSYVLIRIEKIEVHGIPVLDCITDSFYIMEDDAKRIIKLDDIAIETMPRDTYFAWYKANS